MPELPDIAVYLEALETRVLGERLERVRIVKPFLLRTYDPPVTRAEGRAVVGLRRMGKRIVFELEPGDDGDLFLVLHLMIAGRLRWREVGAKPPGRIGLAVFEFSTGCLVLTEAGAKRRASLHCVRSAGLEALDPGGIEVLEEPTGRVAEALRRRNHTLKRALTDPHILSGIGNAYSDEILHRAEMSPFRRTADLGDDDVAKLHEAMREVLLEATESLRKELGDKFPDKVTAFRETMAVHGKFGKSCRVCGAPIQRIVRGDTEANYCPGCQTQGRVLADRALSKLLKDDWPKTLEELESRGL